MKRPIAAATCTLVVLATVPAAAEPARAATDAPPVPVEIAGPTFSLAGSLVRADLLGSIAWLNVENPGDLPYDDWYNRGLYGALAAGWYWTDHLKTEIEAGATTEARVYGARQVVVDRHVGYGSSERTFSTIRVSLAQHYQFFHNAWIHPFVGAGAAVVRETASARHDPVFIFDYETRQSRQALPPSLEGPETTVHVRPFADVGFKAYLTPRAFCRTDLRLVIGDGLDEVMVRVGIGLDVLR